MNQLNSPAPPPLRYLSETTRDPAKRQQRPRGHIKRLAQGHRFIRSQLINGRPHDKAGDGEESRHGIVEILLNSSFL